MEIGKKNYNGEDAATSEGVEVSILTGPCSSVWEFLEQAQKLY